MSAEDESALSRLIEQHEKFLSFVERRVESRAVAEDILQSAFVRGLEHAPEMADENVVAWFYRVLRNAVIDHYRRRAASERMNEVWAREFNESHEPEVEVRKEICQCVSASLSTLKPEYRHALEILDLNEGKLADLAREAGITSENAAVRAHRARKALRLQVEKVCGVCCTKDGCTDCDCGSR